MGDPQPDSPPLVAPPEALPGRRGPGAFAVALLRSARPRQWTKNLLVLAAPAAAGRLLAPEVWPLAALAFVAFCLASSATYLVNDVVDAAADRLHPRKRRRPVAAGLISPVVALGTAAVLVVLALATAAAAGSVPLVAAIGFYAALTLAYSLKLKQVPVLDIMIVAGGFVIRAVAGGLATGVALSEWFLIVASFGALFIVAAKRHAEVQQLGQGGEGRAVLRTYTPEFTRHILTLSSGITIVGYCLWAFEAEGAAALWTALSILPFVGILLRYAMLVEGGAGGEPEEIFLSQRELQLLGLVWVALLAVGVSVG